MVCLMHFTQVKNDWLTKAIHQFLIISRHFEGRMSAKCAAPVFLDIFPLRKRWAIASSFTIALSIARNKKERTHFRSFQTVGLCDFSVQVGDFLSFATSTHAFWLHQTYQFAEKRPNTRTARKRLSSWQKWNDIN